MVMSTAAVMIMVIVVMMVVVAVIMVVMIVVAVIMIVVMMVVVAVIMIVVVMIVIAVIMVVILMIFKQALNLCSLCQCMADCLFAKLIPWCRDDRCFCILFTKCVYALCVRLTTIVDACST